MENLEQTRQNDEPSAPLPEASEAETEVPPPGRDETVVEAAPPPGREESIEKGL